MNATLKNESLSQSPLFKVGGNHIFFPNEESLKLLQGVFENMFREINSEYANKYDLLRSYVQIIIHEAMKIQPPETFYQPANASERISTLFLELLERQFPIDAPSQTMKLKTAHEFAVQLNVHTNTLNRALKESTGKTTTDWIAERMVKEAKALLQFSNWDIAEIAYSLGFEHSSNFIIFFKKQTGGTPLQFRKEIAANNVQ
ncbi:MAG: helix-turn-helix domain-containing protein [Niabella sp.]